MPGACWFQSVKASWPVRPLGAWAPAWEARVAGATATIDKSAMREMFVAADAGTRLRMRKRFSFGLGLCLSDAVLRWPDALAASVHLPFMARGLIAWPHSPDLVPRRAPRTRPRPPAGPASSSL